VEVGAYNSIQGFQCLGGIGTCKRLAVRDIVRQGLMITVALDRNPKSYICMYEYKQGPRERVAALCGGLLRAEARLYVCTLLSMRDTVHTATLS